MNSFLRDKRMKMIADSVRENVTVCDVGSDHALIPIYLVASGKNEKAIITDISRDSLEKGIRNVKKEGLSDFIDAYCTDGVQGIVLPDKCDVIIAGMGGELIADIIGAGRQLQNRDVRLILQPMTKSEYLREFLLRNGFSIVKEDKVTASGKIYCVIVCKYTGETGKVDPKEIYLGFGFDRNNETHKNYAKKIISVLSLKRDGIVRSVTADKERLADIENLLDLLSKELDG